LIFSFKSDASKKISFEKWCELKNAEREKQKEKQKKMDELTGKDEKSHPDENSKAFRRLKILKIYF
jgi:hypothetical protein